MTDIPQVFLFTDFGSQGPYLGLMEAAVGRICPQARVTNLMCDAPRNDPRHAAYLLAALEKNLPADAVVAAVVDPGVGSDRGMIALQAGGRWFLGPDNGLLSRLGRDDEGRRLWALRPQPGVQLSASFHGRDVFAPAAARLACGDLPFLDAFQNKGMVGEEWPDTLAEVVYIDGFGNAMTGIPADDVSLSAALEVRGKQMPRKRTFADVAPGEALCYRNSLGLLEIAINGGSAADMLGLRIGTPVELSLS
ncbi:SAM hydrolase/SAM-dependent halogenase family protein [Thiolapillus sp.]